MNPVWLLAILTLALTSLQTQEGLVRGWGGLKTKRRQFEKSTRALLRQLPRKSPR